MTLIEKLKSQRNDMSILYDNTTNVEKRIEILKTIRSIDFAICFENLKASGMADDAAHKETVKRFRT